MKPRSPLVTVPRSTVWLGLLMTTASLLFASTRRTVGVIRMNPAENDCAAGALPLGFAGAVAPDAGVAAFAAGVVLAAAGAGCAFAGERDVPPCEGVCSAGCAAGCR